MRKNKRIFDSPVSLFTFDDYVPDGAAGLYIPDRLPEEFGSSRVGVDADFIDFRFHGKIALRLILSYLANDILQLLTKTDHRFICRCPGSPKEPV